MRCVLVLLLAAGLTANASGRKLLQSDPDLDNIQWPSPQGGNNWDNGFFGRSVQSTADVLRRRNVNSNDFVTTILNRVQRAFGSNRSWNFFMCDLNDNCNPSFNGGPYNGNPGFYRLRNYFGTDYGVWVFRNGRADDCRSRNTGRSHWFFFGGSRQNDGCTFVW